MKDQAKGISALKAAITGTDSPLEDLLNRPARAFDPDAWHVMNERDNELIRDQVLHGYVSKDFVYKFDIKGTTVTGISVIGARELASQYGGIKARIMATVEKRGALFIFRQFSPMSIETRTIADLTNDVDFYECIMEISDIKTGNSIEVRKKELRMEQRSAAKGGGSYERPHFDVIAESKAYRNGVLAILPQNVISEFESRCLNAGNLSKEKTIGQLREGIMSYAAKHSVHLRRDMIAELTYAQINGLGVAAKDGPDEFKKAAAALGLTFVEQQTPQTPQSSPNIKDVTVDQSTGEITQENSDFSHSYEQVVKAINLSKTNDDLDVAIDLIDPKIIPVGAQKELLALAKDKRSKL